MVCRNAMRPAAPRAVTPGIATHWDQRWTVTMHGDAGDGLHLASMRAAEWRSLLDGNTHLQRLLRGVETKLLVGWPVVLRRSQGALPTSNGNRTAGVLVHHPDRDHGVAPLHEVSVCGLPTVALCPPMQHAQKAHSLMRARVPRYCSRLRGLPLACAPLMMQPVP